MEYTFGGLLRGISRVVLTPEEMKMYDYTNWHDELRMVNDNIMVGKWCSPWTNIPLNWAQFFERRKQPRGKQILFTIRIEAYMTISDMKCTTFYFLYIIFEIHVR